MDYDLKAMLRGSYRAKYGMRRIVLPAPDPSVGAEAGYVKAELAMLRGIAELVKTEIMPRYRPGVTDAAVKDVNPSYWELLAQAAQRLIGVATNTVNRILNLEAKRNTDDFVKIAKKELGIDLRAVVREGDLDGYLRTAAARNANLIKGLADQTLTRIQELTTQSVLRGESHAILWKKLAKEFGLSETRARLIARDQIGKLTSDMNRIRHEQAGIKRYTWSTSLDERVRPLHRDLEGKEYAYGEPTGAEDGLPPGQPIQCRCIARPIVEF